MYVWKRTCETQRWESNRADETIAVMSRRTHTPGHNTHTAPRWHCRPSISMYECSNQPPWVRKHPSMINRSLKSLHLQNKTQREREGINTAVQGQTNPYTHKNHTHTVLYNANTAVWVNSGSADRSPASHTDIALSKNEFAQTAINSFTPNHGMAGTLGQEGQTHLFMLRSC